MIHTTHYKQVTWTAGYSTCITYIIYIYICVVFSQAYAHELEGPRFIQYSWLNFLNTGLSLKRYWGAGEGGRGRQRYQEVGEEGDYT